MQDFVDYYEIMQISPNAEYHTITRVYRMLASRYHPDNPATGNQEMFLQLQHAYEVLSDPERRAAYNTELETHSSKPLPEFAHPDFFEGVEAENNRRLGILCLLYNQRRWNPDRPAISLFDLEARMGIPREHLEFATWYLVQRCFLLRRDGGDLSITADGVDYVESKKRNSPVIAKLLRRASAEPGDGRSGSGSGDGHSLRR